MWKLTRKFAFVCLIHICENILFLSCQEIDNPRGPWQLAFKVVSGNWDQAATNYATFWELFTSTDTYNTDSPVPDQRDFSTSSDHYKSDIVEQWEDGYISVQAIKLAFFKNNEEKAYVVFDAVGKTKTTWFKCDNILYSSYTDLPDNNLQVECPGRNVYNGLPLTLMKISYQMDYCHKTTGWLVVADTDFGFTLCPTYMPADGTIPKPYFKYSSLTTIADLSTQLETADSMGIFFQVWDMAFKGIEGIKPAASGLSNLTGLFMLDLTENDNSDLTVRNLQHSQSSQIFKSGVINLWDTYFIDTVKFSMLKSGVEHAYVVFDGTNTDKTSWFSESNILYSSYGNSLNDASLEVCSIEGDTNRNWQIQSLADDAGCSSAEQLGWMLVKEPKNNGTCSWDTSNIKKKPYFLYNTGSSAANPSVFQYADVIAVFVHGWRLVMKVAAGGSVSPKSCVYSLWTESGGLNEEVSDATTLSSDTTFKSSIIDQWTSYYIRAVKIAAYKNDMEVFNAVFDATGGTYTDWLDCNRLLYTSVTGLTSSTAASNGYTCSLQGGSSSFRFLIGKSPDCGTVSATGVFSVVDTDSTCSSRNDLPQFVFSNTLETTLTDMTESQLADTFAVFVDMANCYSDTCLNGATCQDLGGNYRCFCAGNYYGDTCENLDGAYGAWSSWSACSVTCAEGTQTRTRMCTGTEGDGICVGDSSETIACTLDPCPIDGGYTEWNTWSQCTVTCGTGTRTRSRDCTNPAPQYGGSDCIDPSSDNGNCNTNPCPIDGGLTDWSDWSACSVTCEAGTLSRERTCTNPAPQHGGANCTGETSETIPCDLGTCPIDGGYTEWSEWDTCSFTCGGGQQSRTRDCTNPSPQFEGNPCSGDDTDTQTCNNNECPIDGGYTEWSEWDTCSFTCGGGQQSRTRDCTNPSPQFEGNPCSGDDTDTQSCNNIDCPIDGGYTEWSEWDTCSFTCGGGQQSRTRDCTNPSPQFEGNPCSGDDTDTQTCNNNECPIDGGYTEWSEWDTCSFTCGGGQQSRTRDCTNPSPQFEGNPCSGDDTDTQSCNNNECPIDGGYTEWSEWDACSFTCGGGQQSRTRDCTNPSPQFEGNPCSGDDTDTKTCNNNECPIDGGYTEWSEWDTCSITCGGGQQSRTRDCTNPSPQFEGNPCSGDDTDTQSCNNNECPIDGGYTEWSEWDTCSFTCGGGQQSRTRDCTNPSPQFEGNPCSGDDTDTQLCNNNDCPIDGGYTEWSEWDTCSFTCGGGQQSRTRDCTNPSPQFEGNPCSGDDTATRTCNNNECPIDGGYTEWSEWGTCSFTCGGGQQSRTRDCTNPSPQFEGNPCSGDDTDTQTCNNNECPIDGGYTEWSEWDACSFTCGGGQQSRTRDCTNPSPQFEGDPCSGDDTDTQTCNNNECPIDGGYTEWSEWDTCSVTCGGGQQSRTRDCTNPSPQFEGNPCSGDDTDTQTCNNNECPIDGGYTEWSEWDACSFTCGGGQQSRTRDCTNPSPQFEGNPCSGDDTDTQTCNNNECPIDGGYTEWSEWDTCSVTCGGGQQSRTRDCTNPSPQFEGNPCSGDDTDTKTCNNNECPIDGGYTEWSEWDTCSITCGGGQQSRTRDCTNPSPQFEGNPCSGDDTDTQSCNNNECPIDGGYTEWSEWDTCSFTCGGGQQSRTRDCTNPSPQFEGNPCSGDDTDTQSCNNNECPIDGGYTEWSEWDTCSFTCGGGQQSRTRDCTNPSPQFEGNPCSGDDTDTQTCNNNECPIDGGYTEWSEWDACSFTCGGGQQSRTRDCTNPSPQFEGNPCSGDDTDTQSCNNNECPIDGGYTEWSEWDTCSFTCGGGQQSRTRHCTNPSPQFEGNPCSGDDTDTRTCNNNECPIDGGYTEWSEWDTCSVTCGGGQQSRTRDCTNPSPQFEGNPCSGDDTDTQSCNNIDCPIDGGYTEWSEWDTCSVTCGGGQQSRTRDCTNPSPQFEGNPCPGDDTDTQSCNNNDCPIDGGYTEWSEWGTCSFTCGGGQQSRTRYCTNPSPQFEGNPCSGDDTDTQSCNNIDCPIDGGYTEWSEWDTCSFTCGGGQQSRTRDCKNPSPQFEGNPCSGDDTGTQTCNNNECPIDGGYTEWSEWDTCSFTCGGGQQSRTRDCTNPSPQFDGNPCSGDDTDTQTCNNNECPIDGGYTEWSEWDTCSFTCGGGQQSRTRDCTNPSPQFEGNPCSGDDTDTQSCNNIDCPIDGGYTEWSEWDTCSFTCGGGQQSRTRDCTNPSPLFEGNPCSGDDTDTQSCNNIDCPIDGGYTEWSEWDTCSFTCGGGQQSRTRDCTNPSPQFEGNPCSGDDTDTQTCNNNECPIDGGYTEWSEWDTCSITCGGGQQSRTRDCTNPSPQFEGNPCSGDDTDIQSCNNIDCPIDGGYTEWSEWDTCSFTCGGGQQSRTRDCTNPSPQFEGNPCSGDDTNTQTCNNNECPIDGGYTEWSEWDTCSFTCGGGQQSRTRDCTNPSPQFEGNPCSGDDTDTQSCNNIYCPIDGGYTEWSEWDTCSFTCGGGQQSRTRDCTNPSPQFEGNPCSGDDTNTQTCNNNECPIDGGYTEWSEWDTCSFTCGGGQQSRTRDCTNPSPQFEGNPCSGDDTDTQSCNNIDCPIDGGYTEWSEWDTCSFTCGGGQQSRTRDCTNPSPQFEGNSCSGDGSNTQTCNNNECPIDGGYTEWSEWDTCSFTCGGGQQSRTRDCTNPSPQFEGNPCSGDDTDTQSCNNIDCPIDGGYTEWSEWDTCSLSCDTGLQSRTRECTSPSPQFGGNLCSGDNIDTQTCNTFTCPIDGGYSDWGVWSVCSVTCGGGETVRSRECTNPVPQYGGSLCSGADTETEVCNEDYCPVDGGFSEWTQWSICTKTCGSGQQTRSRDCNNPIPLYGGSDCIGTDTDVIECNVDLCADELGFSMWSDWTSCTKSCDSGIKARSRECLDPNIGCTGSTIDTWSCNTQPCPIDGGYTVWSDWSACSVTCGDGESSRTRECTNPTPEHGGATCVGESTETLVCNEGDCPVDGGYTAWTEWSTCSVTCGDGESSRTRECTNPTPEHGGATCVGESTETLVCNEGNCPVDGGFTDWSGWGECTVTCGGGEQTRTRTCTNPEPQSGGSDCSGDTEESQACNVLNCPVNGGYTAWSEWSTCSVVCGVGDISRTRECTNPMPEHGGATCVGVPKETLACNAGGCPVDGGFTDWSGWGECTVTCGGGEQTRTRTCTNPEPQSGGSDCSGDTEESQACNVLTCPVDGGFTEWSSWTSCSLTCGDGQQTKTRACTNPVPQLGGKDCEGDTEESQICNLGNCPVHGGFTDWSPWDECSVTCEDGVQTRTRNCSNPQPLHGGDDCVGDSEETKTCSLGPCPVDGYWTEWEEWVTCSVSCGSGTRDRTRTCVEPTNGGKPCVGVDKQLEFCNTQICPVDGSWSQWTEWGNCSETCGGGIRIRNRTCIGPLHGGEDCVGSSQENETCNEDPCPIDGHWSDWEEWSTCTVTCNAGTRERSRTCTKPQYGGEECQGAAMQSEFCNTQPCPVDGVWLGWSDWSTCSASCGGGSQNRSRACVEPLHGGEDCVGEPAETEICNEDPCPVDGYWQDWSNWGPCSVSCGDGVRNRSRACVGPFHGGSECVGENSQSDACNYGNCPIDGYWSEWSEWTKCTKTCGGGLRNKTRSCNEPLYGGRACEGELSEMDTCNIDACPIDGEWSDWTPWSTCTATCGGGTREKTRSCSEPKYGGKFCDGEASETDMCNIDPCPVDGYWEEWADWTECTVSCQGGSRNRSRTCVEPKFGGKECVGNDAEIEECNTHMCPVYGTWTEWSEWTVCTATCNGGIRGRARNCTILLYGGESCNGPAVEVGECGFAACTVVDGEWTAWSEWSECSSTCSGGARNRSRSCIAPMFDGKNCEGHSFDIQICAIIACPPVDGGWSAWSAWTACSMTCGFAERLRNRTCTDPTPEWGGRYCEGVHIQSDSCKENVCPVDGEWTEWTDWSPCYNMTVNNVTNPKCGRGFKQRNRSCDNPAPQFEGSDCSGDAADVTTCRVPCHKITCSKEHPEQCQIIFEYIPENKGSTVPAMCSTTISILFIFMRLIM